MVVVKGLSVGKMVMIKVLVVLIVMVKNFLAEGIRGQLRIRTKMIIRNNTQLKSKLPNSRFYQNLKALYSGGCRCRLRCLYAKILQTRTNMSQTRPDQESRKVVK